MKRPFHESRLMRTWISIAAVIIAATFVWLWLEAIRTALEGDWMRFVIGIIVTFLVAPALWTVYDYAHSKEH